MVASYVTFPEVKAALAGDVPNMDGTFDASIASKCVELSADIDRMVAQARGQGSLWSFLADVLYGSQLVAISTAAGAPVTAGTFTLRLGTTTTAGIAWNAAASAVASALTTALGSGTATVTGLPGGPWTVTFAGSLSGPQPVLFGDGSGLTAAAPALVTVQELVRGVAAVPSTRLYTGPAGGSTLLPIDDCVSVASVALYTRGTLVRTLVAGTDYVTRPLQGTPITALDLLTGTWPEERGSIHVGAPWGFATALSYDVREAIRIEVIRAYRADQAGTNDTIGVTPFGTPVLSKAFSQKLMRLVSDASMGAGFLR